MVTVSGSTLLLVPYIFTSKNTQYWWLFNLLVGIRDSDSIFFFEFFLAASKNTQYFFCWLSKNKSISRAGWVEVCSSSGFCMPSYLTVDGVLMDDDDDDKHHHHHRQQQQQHHDNNDHNTAIGSCRETIS